jgi:hypothetical protein
LLSGRHFLPGYLPPPDVSLFNGSIQHNMRGLPDVGSDTIPFNIRNDWLFRNL